MAEERKDGGLRAANMARGAIQGMAAGGPLGAVAGAAAADGETFVKAVAAMGTLLMLPVLFLLLLPGLIFGGFQDANSPHDAAAPILNSETAIIETANELELTVNGILQEGLDDVKSRIQTDFEASGADCMEINDPYAAGVQGNIRLFIAQYCAARSADLSAISLADLEKVLRGAKQELYSYIVTEEIRERIEMVPAPESESEGEEANSAGTESAETDDANAGEAEEEPELVEVVVTETWRVYTIRYNGEGYFADEIFHLCNEQKQLAEYYAQNLSLFLGDGLMQTPGNGAAQSIPSLGDVCFTDGATPVIYYNQRDERYAEQDYGTDNIGEYGCGPTCMAMVVSSLTGAAADPIEMAKWAYDNGCWIDGGGSYHALIPAAAQHWGLPVSGCSASEPQRIVDALSQGKFVVAIMGAGHFTDSGHFIVLRGVQNGQIMVADPYSVNYSNRLWDLSLILGEASTRAAAGGPFWIIG